MPADGNITDFTVQTSEEPAQGRPRELPMNSPRSAARRLPLRAMAAGIDCARKAKTKIGNSPLARSCDGILKNTFANFDSESGGCQRRGAAMSDTVVRAFRRIRLVKQQRFVQSSRESRSIPLMGRVLCQCANFALFVLTNPAVPASGN
jgi:hypothetical protein